MPLSGDPDKDIPELMRSYERKGTIGNARPKTRAKALQMSIAIALEKERKKKKEKAKR